MQGQEALLKEIFELALANDAEYGGCTQSVLAALQEKLNVVSADVFRAGSALSGGVAAQGETCGALTGAIMAIGCLVGRTKLEDRETYRKSLQPAMEVYCRFSEKIGHTLCWEIHKIRYGRFFRLGIPEEHVAFINAGGHSRRGCPEVCGIAARIAAEVILEMKEKDRESN